MQLRERAPVSRFRLKRTSLLCAVLLAGCGARGVQIEQSPLLRLFEARSGLVSYLGLDGNIHVIDQKGGGRIDITTNAGQSGEVFVRYGLSTWSPDGRHVAFPVYRSSQSGDSAGAEIVTASKSGSETGRFLTGTALLPIYLSWAPDSSMIAILSSVPGLGALELGIASLAEGGGYSSVDTGAPYYWDWSADNRTLVAHVNSSMAGGGAERVTLVSADNPGWKEDLPIYPAVFQAPDLTRDGRQLAYVAAPGGIPSLIVRELQTSTERTLTQGGGPLYFSFSPDGKRIAVLHAAGVQPVPFGSLEILSLDDHTPPRSVEEELVIGFFWSPDGSRVAVIVASDGSGADPAFLQEPNALYVRLMVLDVRSGKSRTAATYPPTRGFVELLPFFDQYLRSVTPWSPDGKHIVFTAYAHDGAPSVYIAHADGGIKPRLLARGDAAFWSWR